MLFNSLAFLFVFLPVTLGGFFLFGKIIGKSAAFLWLIVASIFFYASWQFEYLWLLVFSLIFNFIAAQLIRKITKYKFFVLTATVLINIAILVYYKLIMAGLFDITTDAASFSTTQDIIIPLAISFITFQQIAFVIDSYHGKIQKIQALEYFLFITFFPQLIMGPIVHYRELIPQFRSSSILRFCTENIALGISIFIIGLFKKVYLADNIAPYVNSVYEALHLGENISAFDAWGAAIGFQFQLYFDFSGYADMAIGLGRMFNINLPINFDSPYRAVNRFDYWRRWHISFGSFMRQYVFFPLARSKKIPLGNVGALLITTMLSGFWHGLALTFIVWGALQSLIMLLNHYRVNLLNYIGIKNDSEKQGFSWVAMILTFCTTLFLGVIFRSN